MIRVTLTASAVMIAASGAFGGGLDRSGQPIGILFEDGNYAELSFGAVSPDVTGTDLLGNAISNVADNFVQFGGGIKYQFNDKVSVALIAEQPFGSDVFYTGSAATTLLGGTAAMADTMSLTALGRYEFTDRFSVHGGVRYQAIDADITLSGLAYGGLSGYNVAMSRGDGFGFVIGGAYEIPEYALRVALTYNSAITHNLPSTETIGGFPIAPVTDTEIMSPASVNLDFQTGLNPKTLLFGSVRYAQWSDLIISPTAFDALVDPLTPNSSISSLDDTWNFTVGLGRKITDRFSASAVLGYETGGSDDLVSPLSPTNGNWSIGLGGRYTVDNVTISGGIRYTFLGDARPETGTPDTARANFTDNDAIAIGLKVGFSF